MLCCGHSSKTAGRTAPQPGSPDRGSTPSAGSSRRTARNYTVARLSADVGLRERLALGVRRVQHQRRPGTVRLADLGRPLHHDRHFAAPSVS